MINPKSWHLSSSASICTGHSQKKIVLVLCIVTWAAIFLISGTLFVKRRYETDNQLVSKLSSSLQEQIDNLSFQFSKEKTSAKDLAQALHEKFNLTLSGLDVKINALEREFAEKRQRAVQALHALHGGTLDVEKEKPGQQPTTQPAQKKEAESSAQPIIEMKSGAGGMCVDSMEQPVGSDVQLNSCHAQGRNQAWSHKESNRLIENKAINMCLRTEHGSDGSPVKTAACNENDTLQKWNRVKLLFMLDNGAMSGMCLDVDTASNKLVIKGCDSTKESQHWTY